MSRYRTVTISELTPGSRLVTPVLDERLVKLVDAGTVVTQHLIESLKARGISEVVVYSSSKTIVGQPEKPLPTEAQERLKASPNRLKPVENCSVCGTLINLQPPTPELKASAWYCTTCGAVYFGSDDDRTQSHGIYRADPAVQNPFVESAGPSIPSENVKRIISALAPEEYKGPELRRHKRYPVVVPVIALPLSLDFRIDGEPMQMTTADVSLGGAAFVYTRFVNAHYLAIDFTAAGVQPLQAVLKVLRVQSLGLVYKVSGEFISRLILSETTK